MNDAISYIEEMVEMMKEKKYDHIEFSFVIKESDVNIPIEHLDLKTRSINGLKRAGIFTLKDLAERVSNSKDLKGIRNLGKESSMEIMRALLCAHINRNIEEKRKPLHGINVY